MNPPKYITVQFWVTPHSGSTKSDRGDIAHQLWRAFPQAQAVIVNERYIGVVHNGVYAVACPPALAVLLAMQYNQVGFNPQHVELTLERLENENIDQELKDLTR